MFESDYGKAIFQRFSKKFLIPSKQDSEFGEINKDSYNSKICYNTINEFEKILCRTNNIKMKFDFESDLLSSSKILDGNNTAETVKSDKNINVLPVNQLSSQQRSLSDFNFVENNIKENVEMNENMHVSSINQALSYKRSSTETNVNQNSLTEIKLMNKNIDVSLIDQILSQLQTSSGFNCQRPLIQNGLTIGENLFVIQGKDMSVGFYYTCWFDAIIEVIVTAYFENPRFAVEFDLFKVLASFQDLVQSYVTSKFSLEKVYETRGSILYPIFSNNLINNSNIPNCTANVVTQFEWLMKDFPCITQVYKKKMSKVLAI